MSRPVAQPDRVREAVGRYLPPGASEPPSPELLARLARRFKDAPGHATWRARHAEAAPAPQESRAAAAAPAPKRTGIRTGVPACGSFW